MKFGTKTRKHSKEIYEFNINFPVRIIVIAVTICSSFYFKNSQLILGHPVYIVNTHLRTKVTMDDGINCKSCQNILPEN